MDQPIKPSPIRFAVQGWVDTINAWRRMPLIFGIAAAAFFVMDTSWELVADRFPITGDTSRFLLWFLHSCLGGFTVAPMAIAIHRYVILSEVSAHYSFNVKDKRLVKFVGAEIIYSAGLFAPLAAISLIMSTGKQSLALMFGSLFAIVAVAMIAIRLLLIFPAIAVDAPGANWSNALADSRGKTLRLFLTLALASLVVLVPMYSLFLIIPTTHPIGRNIFSVVQCIGHILSIAVTATIASHFFRIFGQRLKNP